MELIQYTPRTETTYSIPIVFIQPWVNKFYILDLTEEKSLVSYLLNHGFTVFITSWKNPDESMREVSFDDYIRDGVDEEDFVAARKARDAKLEAPVLILPSLQVNIRADGGWPGFA